VTDARRVSPLDEANRVLLEAVHPADWVNPEPRAGYDSALEIVRPIARFDSKKVNALPAAAGSCSASRFQSLAKRFFGHTKHTHALITPRERAWAKFGMRPGDPVRFRFEGAQYTGIVNRITKRATVLVRDTQGRQYGDGHRYARFYVPVESLETLQSDQSNEK